MCGNKLEQQSPLRRLPGKNGQVTTRLGSRTPHLLEEILGERLGIDRLVLGHADWNAARRGARKAAIARCHGMKAIGFERRDQIAREPDLFDLHDGFERGQAALRSTMSLRISEMALAGLRPLGQVLAQFMMVWQR